MARKVFFSFHFQEDCWRTGQVRNIGTIEGSKPIRDNDWEEVKRKGEYSIQSWIDNQLYGTSCVIVLIGSQTASRRWIQYEIRRAWELGKGVMGIYIHQLLNDERKTSAIGNNPFNQLFLPTKQGFKNLGTIIPVYNPPYSDSKQVYWHIETNLESWVEDAIYLRKSY